MKDRLQAMVLASFVADSLALGVHWIYDTKSILKNFGRVESLLKPSPDSYHPTKEKGDFTHYGDQTLVLLESIAAKKGFDLNDFSARWRGLFDTYEGYFDEATRITLSHYSSGKTAENAGSPSDDLAGASRIAPLVYAFHEDLDKLVDYSRSQTKMTHNNPVIIESAEFFARVARLVLNGTPPARSIKKVSQEQFENSSLSRLVQAGLQSKDTETTFAISRFGQSCHTEEAFPGVIHLIARYGNDLREALIQSVMAGGDSAARGMMVGMVLGAQLGKECIPEEWLSQLRKRDQILELLDKFS